MARLRTTLAFVTLSIVLMCGVGTEAQACDDALQVASATASGSDVFASVANSSSTTRKGYLILNVLLRGNPATVSVPISVPAEGSVGTTVTFAVEVQFTGGDACEYDPGGNTESPNPIIAIKTKEEDESESEN